MPHRIKAADRTVSQRFSRKISRSVFLPIKPLLFVVSIGQPDCQIQTVSHPKPWNTGLPV